MTALPGIAILLIVIHIIGQIPACLSGTVKGRQGLQTIFCVQWSRSQSCR